MREVQRSCKGISNVTVSAIEKGTYDSAIYTSISILHNFYLEEESKIK